MTLGTVTDKEKKFLRTHSDESDPVERAELLHGDYTDALDHWQDFAEGREGKILLWKYLHDTMTPSSLHYRLKDEDALPDVDTLRTALGIHIQDLQDPSDFFDMWEKDKSYADLMDFNQKYTGSSHFVEFGRELRQRRTFLEIAARQYISYLRFGEIKEETGSEWDYDDPVDAETEFFTQAFEGSYVETVDRWERLFSRLHESKEGQKYLASLWKGGAVGAPYPSAVLIPTKEEWNEGASKYFQESSYPGRDDYADFTFEKTSSTLFQVAKQLASHVQPGLTYLYATESDLDETTTGLGEMLSLFVSDSEFQSATSGANGTVVSPSALAASGTTADDVVKFLATINAQGGAIAEAPENANTYVNDWLKVTLLGTGLICGAIFQDEKDTVSASAKSELEAATDTASGVVSYLSWGGTANTLLESLNFETIDTFGKAGKAATIAGPFLTTIDVLWSVHDSVEAGSKGDGSVAFGQAIGAIGSATMAASSIYAAAAAEGSFFTALAGGASGGPITLAVAGVLIVGGLALSVWTKDAPLTTFFENCRFGTNWEWQAVDRTGDGYHDPSTMWYMWNDTTHDPACSGEEVPEDHGPANYPRQVSSFITLLHGVEASAAYDKDQFGIVELKNLKASPTTLLTMRPIEATELEDGSNIYELRTDWSVETRLHQFGGEQDTPTGGAPYLWPSDPSTAAVALNKAEPHEPPKVSSSQATSEAFQTVIVKPKPASTGGYNSYELPETITYWKGKRAFTSDGTTQFQESFGLTETEAKQVNNSTWNHWLEVSLTSEALSTRAGSVGSDAGLRDDYSAADVPIAIRVRTTINVNALDWA